MRRLLFVVALVGGVAGAVESRQGPSAPAPVPEQVGPAWSIHLTTERTDARGTRRLAGQTVVRTGERVTLVPDGSRKEWVFEKNPLDARRVSGYLVDHDARQVLMHHESDLRNRERLSGWSDVWHMRFDPKELGRMIRTDERSTIGGVPFVRYQRHAGLGVTQVDWNHEHGLPGRVEVRDADGLTVLRIDRLTREDGTSPGDPRFRYPDYEILDVADLGEHRH